MNTYHILNGDSLKEQFPNTIAGEQIIMRECLVSGNVKADSLDKFYQVRSEFIDNTFGDGIYLYGRFGSKT